MSAEDLTAQNQNISRKEVEKMFLREDKENLGDRADVYWKVLNWVKSKVSRLYNYHHCMPISGHFVLWFMLMSHRNPFRGHASVAIN